MIPLTLPYLDCATSGTRCLVLIAWKMTASEIFLFCDCCPCSTGWLSHWGEVMANTSASFVLQTLSNILEYGNGTGSVNFYMAHGGSNFGYWAGVLSCSRLLNFASPR